VDASKQRAKKKKKIDRHEQGQIGVAEKGQEESRGRGGTAKICVNQCSSQPPCSTIRLPTPALLSLGKGENMARNSKPKNPRKLDLAHPIGRKEEGRRNQGC
jgi:hypothetical protein